MLLSNEDGWIHCRTRERPEMQEHLDLPTKAPVPYPPRAPPQMEMEYADESDESVDWLE